MLFNTTTMAALTQNNCDSDSDRTILSDSTKQSSSGQDFATSGITNDSRYMYLVIADGHGKWSSETIRYLRHVQWATIIQTDEFMEKIKEDIKKLNTKGEGSTLSVVRILDHRIICEGQENGYIEVYFIGDSTVKVYRDGEEIFKTKDHDRDNLEDIKRIMETCNMRGIERNNIWDIEVIDNKRIKSVPAAIFDFGGSDKINFTNSLGHNGKTGSIVAYNKILMDDDKTYKVVAGSDGLWGMTHAGDGDFLARPDTNAKSIVEFANRRWRQKWIHDNTVEIVDDAAFPESNIDDICAAVCLIKPLIL